jgi:hypothetical protein
MDLVLNKEIDQRYQRAKKPAGHDLPILDCRGIVGTECKAAQSPGHRRNHVGDHEDVMPTVVIGGCYVCPATTRQGSKDSHPEYELGQGAIGSRSQNIPKGDEGKSRAYRRISWAGRMGALQLPEVMAMKSMKTDRSG